MGRIFGTDGVRGVAISELTVDLALKIGKAVANVFAPNGGKILIGKDTRLSSSSLESAIAAGVTSCGVDAILLGVVPTPAVAYLTKYGKSSAGIMVSASHNSFEFNGIKVFDSEGFKISDKNQNDIENLILSDFQGMSYPKDDCIGVVKHEKYYVGSYINYLRKMLNSVNLKIVIDCANGAAYQCVGKVFKGIDNFEYVNYSPNGCNINKDCGSTYLASLSHYVIKNELDLGISFDGDADRCLAVDRFGEVIDGDHIIASMAVAMKENSTLSSNTVVGTKMSNMGFEKFLENNGIKLIRADIGDRFVVEEMKKHNSSIGGEQSGHIIFSDYSTTGDAILTAIMLINLVSDMGDSSKISRIFQPYPQFVKNIKISKDANFEERLKNSIQKLEKLLSNDGRVFVRKSGTEPLIRVMCESKSFEKLDECEAILSDI